MTTQIDATRISVGALVGAYERRPVQLPAFQRPYSWEKAQVEAFISDLLNFVAAYSIDSVRASYFLGSIVLIETESQIQLLDGQQRLATVTIVLAAIRDIARSLDTGKQKGGADLARDIQKELIEKDTEPSSYALTLGELDEPYFLKRIKNDPPSKSQDTLRSTSLINAAYDIANMRVKAYVDAKPYDQQIVRLKTLKNALTKGMALIAIKVESEEDAYQIFETLNDRGLRLSVPDLVLNLIMRRAQSPAERRVIRHKWNVVLQELGKRDVSRFIRHMWVSQYGDLKDKGLYTAIKEHLQQNTVSSIDFADSCADECSAYVAIMEGTITGLTKKGRKNLDGIVKYLGISSAPPLLLAAYKTLKLPDFEKILGHVIRHHIRYAVLANQNPARLDETFFDASRELRVLSAAGKTSAQCLKGALLKMDGLTVSDALVSSGTTEVRLARAPAVWMMAQLANSLQSSTNEIGMNEANLEHVYPQNADAAWPATSAMEELIWNIGNLTILGERLNRKAQNKKFEEKRDNFYAQSEIMMTQSIARISAWNPAAVRKRALSLAKSAIKLWPEQ